MIAEDVIFGKLNKSEAVKIIKNGYL